MRGEYADNHHAYMANDAIWLVNLYEFWNNPQDLFVGWYKYNIFYKNVQYNVFVHIYNIISDHSFICSVNVYCLSAMASYY